MSELAIVDSDAFRQMEKVASLYVKGVTSPHTIARRLNIKVVEARAAIETWHQVLQEDSESRDMARDHLNAMVQRYDKLLEEANDNLDRLNMLVFDEKVSAQINTTLRSIADFDAKRVDLLQKAGLMDVSDLGDDLAERERREEMLLSILRNDLCDACKFTVRDKITRMTGTVEGSVVSD